MEHTERHNNTLTYLFLDELAALGLRASNYPLSPARMSGLVAGAIDEGHDGVIGLSRCRLYLSDLHAWRVDVYPVVLRERVHALRESVGGERTRCVEVLETLATASWLNLTLDDVQTLFDADETTRLTLEQDEALYHYYVYTKHRVLWARYVEPLVARYSVEPLPANFNGITMDMRGAHQ